MPGPCGTCSLKPKNIEQNTAASWVAKLSSTTCGILRSPLTQSAEGHHGAPSVDPHATNETKTLGQSTHKVSAHGTNTFAPTPQFQASTPRVPAVLRKKQRRTKTTPENAKATSGLRVNAIPSSVQEEDETELLCELPAKVELMYELPAKAGPVSHLETLPSQLLATRAKNASQRTIPRKRLPQAPTISEIGTSDLGVRNNLDMNTRGVSPQIVAMKPLPPAPTPEKKSFAEYAASDVKRTSAKLTKRQPLSASAVGAWSQGPIAKSPLAAHPVALPQGLQAPPELTDRHSQTDQQVAELFLGEKLGARQVNAKTLAILNGGQQSYNYDQAAEHYFHDESPKSQSRMPATPAYVQDSELSLAVPRQSGNRNTAAAAARAPTVLRSGCPDSSQQDLKTFLSGLQRNTNSAPPPPSRDGAKATRTPNVLRSGRPDSTYISSSVGQIPGWHDAISHTRPISEASNTQAAGNKKKNREACLSQNDVQRWDEFISENPITPKTRKAVKSDFQIPDFTDFGPLHMMGKLKSREEVRMSARISKPGLHDYYTATLNTKATASELPAFFARRMEKGGKGENGIDTQSYGLAPRLQKPHRASPQPSCAWDGLVAKACSSRESLNARTTK
jgi:hypothetical protein